MPDGVPTTWFITEALFLGSGVLTISTALIWMHEMNKPTDVGSVAITLLLRRFPLQAMIANAALIFFALLVALPAVAIPTSRTWLKVHGWLIVACAAFTLVLGLHEWILTLQTRANLLPIWAAQPRQIQSLLQQRFNCCGYVDWTSPPYVQDSVCVNDIIAASKLGCVGPFSNFAETWLNLVFTIAFGMVGVDCILLLCVAMVIKTRKQQLRYRRIDEKRGIGSI